MKGSPPRIELRARVEPAVWSADALVDVRFHLELINRADRPAAVYPGAAQLAERISMAGVGIAWSIQFRGDGRPVRTCEIRSWYGPPGEPPLGSYVEQQTRVLLAPSAAHEIVIPACWIPNARLESQHLDPAQLDPQGMNGVAERADPSALPAGYELPPPVARLFPLHQASVLVFGMSAAGAETAMNAGVDFLRNSVVAFFGFPGDYDVEAAYLQHSWMGIGDKLTATAAVTSIRIAAPDPAPP